VSPVTTTSPRRGLSLSTQRGVSSSRADPTQPRRLYSNAETNYTSLRLFLVATRHDLHAQKIVCVVRVSFVPPARFAIARRHKTCLYISSRFVYISSRIEPLVSHIEISLPYTTRYSPAIIRHPLIPTRVLSFCILFSYYNKDLFCHTPALFAQA